MAILDYLDDWKLDFNIETDEYPSLEQYENNDLFIDDLLEVFNDSDTKDMTMQ